MCVSFSAKKKSVLKKSLFEVRDGDAGVMFSTRVREQLQNWCRFDGGGVCVCVGGDAKRKKLTDAAFVRGGGWWCLLLAFADQAIPLTPQSMLDT